MEYILIKQSKDVNKTGGSDRWQAAQDTSNPVGIGGWQRVLVQTHPDAAKEIWAAQGHPNQQVGKED
jgi:hypothetical protein